MMKETPWTFSSPLASRPFAHHERHQGQAGHTWYPATIRKNLGRTFIVRGVLS